MQNQIPSNPVLVDELSLLVRGRVIRPGDPEYDAARTPFYGGFDRRPAAIVRAADAGDVSRIVSLARQEGWPLAVRSGGHGGAGHCVIDDGLVLDLSGMRDLQIDVAGRTAWAGAGLTAGEYTTAAGAHGLATGFGDTGSVGLGGITLGGGVGFLVRKFGLTIDSLLAAEVVTADGQFLRADADSHPDLFWALRGGGGNFGVATRFQFRLHEVERILGGILILPATPQVIGGFLAEAQAAPYELSTIANVMTAPPMPFLPAELHGKLIVMVMLAYAGDPAAGERVLAPIRALAAPLADMVRPMRYPEMFPPEEGGHHPLAASRTLFVDALDQADAELLLDRLRTSSGTMAVAQLRVLGGAMAEVPAEATAFAHRGSRIMVNLAALYAHPQERGVHETWAENFAGALRRGDGGAYVNFLGETDEAGVRAAYPGGAWERLREIKSRYDPSNLFRHNHNIPPAGGRRG